MDFLNDLLGLLVLTSPLWLILLYLIVGVWVAFIVARRFKSGGGKLAAVVGVFAPIFLVLFGDELAGRTYLNYLCANKAEEKVYHSVELPSAFWDEQGKPTFLAPNGFVDMALLPKRFEWQKISRPYIDVIVSIDEWRWQLVDKREQMLLGEEILYMRQFGWVRRNFSTAPNIGVSCREIRANAGPRGKADLEGKRVREQDFFSKIFRPATK